MKNDMENEQESNEPNLCKARQYSYRDMLDAWQAGRINLVTWGVVDGDKPDFGSWMRERFGNSTTGI
jgi:hypothetical protein